MVDPTASSRVFHGRAVVADLLAVQFLLKLNSEEGAFLTPVSGGAFFSQSEPVPTRQGFFQYWVGLRQLLKKSRVAG